MTDVCRKHRLWEATFYAWKAKYGGIDVSDARRLRALANERRRRLSAAVYPAAREAEPSGINHIYRLNREEDLAVHKRQNRRRAVGRRAPVPYSQRARYFDLGAAGGPRLTMLLARRGRPAMIVSNKWHRVYRSAQADTGAVSQGASTVPSGPVVIW